MKPHDCIGDGPTKEVDHRLEEAARLGVGPYHWDPNHMSSSRQDNSSVSMVRTCYWLLALIGIYIGLAVIRLRWSLRNFNKGE